MSEPITTERYRLALIAHHARTLAELMDDGTKSVSDPYSIAGACLRSVLLTMSTILEEHLNLNEKETHE